ncbi:DUF2336 domain-containing protein [Bradyrhizobium sp.]|uniref:DUF2336 domain-containing protein n=1 Tax=Bradyrhizobium sp. TaxID=376 RepID=UPI00403776A8
MTMFYSLIDEVQNTTEAGATKRQLKALKRITDLFHAGSGRYSKQQIELFDNIFRTVVGVIELRIRVKLAHHLATDANAPATLVRAFAFDDAVAVAAPVLSRSTALSEADLILCSGTQGQGHLHAIAQRQTISEAITELLIQRGEPRVVHAVAKNPGARISEHSFGELVVRSGGDAQLALHVGMRHDVSRHHLLRILETASATVCRRIVTANPQLADAVKGAVTDVIDDINLELRNGSEEHAKARNRIRRRKDWKELGETDVHAAARAQDFERTVAALSVLASCPIEMVERAVLNENPGAVQIVAKAASCSWATAKALLLMKAADRNLSRMDLDRARENFERLEIRTARRVLEFYEARREIGAQPSPPIAAAEANARAAVG